jgi:uncharacterized protein
LKVANHFMKLILLSFCLLTLTGISISQKSRDTTLENTFLWQVTGPELNAPSYLFGTIHKICEKDIDLPPILLQKLQASRIFYMESVLSKGPVDSARLEGKTEHGIRDMIGNRNFKKVKEIFENYYGPMEEAALDTMNSIDVGNMLMGAALGCKITSYDDSLYTLAKMYNLDVRGLEYLLELKNAMPRGTDIYPTRTWISSFIDRFKIHSADVRKTMERYKQLEINWFYKQAAYLPGGLGESSHKDRYLDGRNKLWVPRMEGAMKEGPSFFAFGCAHLGGYEGIISLLRKKGYTVTPIFYSWTNSPASSLK